MVSQETLSWGARGGLGESCNDVRSRYANARRETLAIQSYSGPQLRQSDVHKWKVKARVVTRARY